MRKVLLFTLAASAIITIAGCLKDKGFENQEYGIQITEVKAVAFPLAATSPIVYGINSSTSPQTVDGPVVTLEQSGKAAKDVHVTLELNPGIVTAASIIPLTVTQYSVNTLNVTIPAGQTLADVVKVTVANSSVLDPTKSYGVGLTIKTVDEGYIIAANQKDIIISFNIKNKYDGKYNLRGFHNRTSPDYTIPYNVTVYMITSGPNSVSMWYPDPGPDDYAHPINGNGGQFYGVFGCNLTFNPADDKITAWDWSPWPTTLPTAVDPASNSRYDPVAKKIYFRGWYNNNPAARAFTDTMTYLGPRP